MRRVLYVRCSASIGDTVSARKGLLCIRILRGGSEQPFVLSRLPFDETCCRSSQVAVIKTFLCKPSSSEHLDVVASKSFAALALDVESDGVDNLELRDPEIDSPAHYSHSLFGNDLSGHMSNSRRHPVGHYEN